MHNKRSTALFLVLALAASCLSLNGCGSSASTAESSQSLQEESQSSEESPEESSEESQEEESSSEESSDSPFPNLVEDDGDDVVKNDQYAVIDPEAPLQEGVLPKKMTELSSGGRIPEGALTEGLLPASVDPVSLKGTWCVEGSDVENPTAATDTMTDTDFISEDGTITGMTVLPDTMVLGLSSSGYSSSTVYDLGYYSSYMLADTTYRKQDGTSFYAIVPYGVSGSTLAFGFYDAGDDDDAILAQEMDYQMDWTGWKLTLTRDGESITYVPTSSIVNAESGTVCTGGSIVPGYDGIDGITGVYPAADDAYIKYGDEKYTADFTFREDGTVTIALKSGKTYNLTFRYSGDTLTLIDGDHVALYAD